MKKLFFLTVLLIAAFFATVGIVQILRAPVFQYFADDFFTSAQSIRFATDMNVTIGAVEVNQSDTAICRGETVSINPLFEGNWTQTANIGTLCVAAGCPTFAVPPFAAANTNWQTSGGYAALMATYEEECNVSKSAPPAPPFALSNAAGTYYRTSADKVGAGRTDFGVFCYGNLQTFLNTTLIQDQDVGAGVSQFNYVLGAAGNYTLRTDLIVRGCAAFVRALQTDGWWRDCVYRDKYNSLGTPLTVAGTPLNITVVGIPNLNLTSSLAVPSPVLAGSNFAWQITVNNTGDAPAQVTGVNIVNATAVVVTTPLPLIIQPNATATIAGTANAPAAAGGYDIMIDVTYNGTTAAIGTCDDARTDRFWLGSMSVYTVFVNRIEIGLAVAPSTICWGYQENLAATGIVTVYWSNGTVEYPTGAAVAVTAVNATGGGGGSCVATTAAGAYTCNLNASSWDPTWYNATATVTFGGLSNNSAPVPIYVYLDGVSVTVIADPASILKVGNSYEFSSITLNTTIYRCGKLKDTIRSSQTGDWNTATLSIYRQPGTSLVVPSSILTLNWPYVSTATNTYPQNIQGWAPSVYQANVSVYDTKSGQTVQGSTFFVIYDLNCLDKA